MAQEPDDRSNVRSVSDSVCFGVNVTQGGTFTVTYVNNDDDTGKVEYFTDLGKMAAFIVQCLKEGFNLP